MAAVRSMFDTIAPRYDLVNRVMTFRMDVGWRKRAVSSLGLVPGSTVIDLACGTGDFCFELERRGHRRRSGSTSVSGCWSRLPTRSPEFRPTRSGSRSPPPLGRWRHLRIRVEELRRTRAVLRGARSSDSTRRSDRAAGSRRATQPGAARRARRVLRAGGADRRWPALRQGRIPVSAEIGPIPSRDRRAPRLDRSGRVHRPSTVAS